METLVSIGKDTVFGNILTLYYFLDRNRIIRSSKLRALPALSSLKYVSDPVVFEFVCRRTSLTLDLDDDVLKFLSSEEIDDTVRICESLLENDIIERNKSSIHGLHVLYKAARSPELKSKEDITIVPSQATILGDYQQKIDQYRSLIKEQAKEPKFQSFFETNPNFLNWQVVKFMSKKSFGGEQFPDLLLVLSNKRNIIVELEKPAVKLYTKKGDPTRQLSHAEDQVRGYLSWAIEEKEFLRKRGLENLNADNTTGLLIVGSNLTPEERRRLETRNNSLRTMLIIKTFSDILEENEAFLNNLKTIPKT